MLILYGIGVLGFFIRKKGVVNEHATTVFTQFILYITLPALILHSLDMPFSFTMISQFSWLISMSFVAMTTAIILARWMGRRSTLPNKQKKAYEGITIFGNQGFIGYAIIFILFQDEGIVYLTIFNIYYLILIWTYGIFLFTSDTDTIDWKKIFLNPGFLSTVAGLILLFSPLSLPEKFAAPLENIGNMTIPLSMIVIGCLIADMYGKNILQLLRNSYIWKSAFVKLLFIPLLLLPFYFFSIPFQILATAVIASGMPSASTISLYAQRFGADRFFSSIGVLVTTILCIFTVPLLYLLVLILY